jgi:hypothetical protein
MRTYPSGDDCRRVRRRAMINPREIGILVLGLCLGGLAVWGRSDKIPTAQAAEKVEASESIADKQERILDAIEWVESRGDVNAIGDGGASLGAYQIGKLYWMDAKGWADGVSRQSAWILGGDMPAFITRVSNSSYEDVKVKAIARDVVRCYMMRWAKAAWRNADAETIARIHNGGPRGLKKQATVAYWKKVEARLKSRKGGE